MDDDDYVDDRPEAPAEEDVKIVSRGKGAPTLGPSDISSYLEDSEHPYAPFTGNALDWSSNVYDDATTFEGLTKEGIPHGKGVMWMGSLRGGAGFQHPVQGDRYEGEFHSGFAHGMGMYTSHDGSEIYRGEFELGKRNGCGALINMKPYYDLLEMNENMDPAEAWERVKPQIESEVTYATWHRDFVAGGIGGGRGRFCSIGQIKKTLRVVTSVVTRARMFTAKPDGDVNIFMLQDGLGVPVTPLQDPMHYPHGTKWMAPGPMGQCFPLPADPLVRAELAKHTRNHLRVWNMFNFARRIRPGSDMFKALQRWRRIMKGRQERKKLLEEAERRRIRRMERAHGVKSSTLPEADRKEKEKPKRRRKKKKAEPGPGDDDGDGDIDDSDLVASTMALDLGPSGDTSEGSGEGSRQRAGGAWGPPPGTVFGSVGLGVARFGSAGLGVGFGSGLGMLGASMGRAAGAAGAVLEAFAERAPRRRSLMRPMPSW